MNITVTYFLYIHEILNLIENVLSHALAIDHRDSLVLYSMYWYHSQTVVAMNQS